MGTYWASDKSGNVYKLRISGNTPTPSELKRADEFIAQKNSAIPTAPEPVEGGIGRSALEFGKGALYGLGSIGSDVLRTAGGIGDYLAGNEEPGLLSRVGKGVETGLEGLFGAAPGYEDALSTGAGRLTGMLGGFLIPGTLAAKPAQAAARIAGEVGLGAAVGGGEAQRRLDQYEEAKGVKLDPETRVVSTLLGSALGTTFAVPVERLAKPLAQLLRFVPKEAASTAAQTIAERLKDAAVTGGVAGVQNVVYGVGQDLVEKGLYNPDIDPTDSIMSDLTVGGGVGALMHFALGRAYNSRLTPHKDLVRTIKEEDAAAAELQQQKVQQEKNFATGASEIFSPELGAAYDKSLKDFAAGAAEGLTDLERVRPLSKPGASEPRRPYVQATEGGGFKAYTEADRPLGQEAGTLDGAVRQMENYVRQLKIKADAEAAKSAPKYPADPAEPRTHYERLAEVDDQIAAARKDIKDLKKTIRTARGEPGPVEVGAMAQARVDRLLASKKLIEEGRANQSIPQEEYLALDRPESGDILGYIKRRRIYGGDEAVDGPLTQRELTEAYAAVNPKDKAPEKYTSQVLDDADLKRKQEYLASKEQAPVREEPEPAPAAAPVEDVVPAVAPEIKPELVPTEPVKQTFVPGERVRLQSGNVAEIAAVRPSGDLRLKNAISDITPDRVQKIEPTIEAPKVEPKAERKPFDLEDVGLKTVDAGIFDKLQQRLHGYGLKSVALKLRNWIERQTTGPDGKPRTLLAEGSMEGVDGVPKVIELATSIYKKGMSDDELLKALARVMDHEVFHAVAGVLEPRELKALENFVLRQKMPGKTYTYVQYHQARAEGKPVDYIMEEAMADAFRDWANGDLKISGQPRTVMAHIFSMFKRIGEWWSGAPGARDVFEKIKSGEVGKRLETFKPAPKGRAYVSDVVADLAAASEPVKKFSTIGDGRGSVVDAYLKEADPQKRAEIVRAAVWHDLKLTRESIYTYSLHYDNLKNLEQGVMNAALHSSDGTVPVELVQALKDEAAKAQGAFNAPFEGSIDIVPLKADESPEYISLREQLLRDRDRLSKVHEDRSPYKILKDVAQALDDLASAFGPDKPQPPTTPSRPKLVVDNTKKFSTIGSDGTYDKPPSTPEEYRYSIDMRVARALDPVSRIRNVEHAAVYNAVHDYLFKPTLNFTETLRSKLLSTTPDYALAAQKAERYATRFVSLFADRMITLAKMIDAIKRRGGTVEDEFDAYAMNDVMQGKLIQRTGLSERTLYNPMKKAMFAMGFAKPDVERLAVAVPGIKPYLGSVQDPNNAMLGIYLYARHAPERNAVEKVKNPNGKIALDEDGRPIEGKWWSSDQLSGMSNEDAAAVMNFFKNDRRFDKLINAAEAADGIVYNLNEIRREAGLIPEVFKYDPEEGRGLVFTKANVRNRNGELGYDKWVPLRGFAEDPEWVDTAPAHGRGFQSLRREDPRAMGRGSMAAKIVENIIALHEQAIVRSERAKIGQAFLKMIQDNADLVKDMARVVDKAPLKWSLVDGNFRIMGKGPDGKDVVLDRSSGLHGRLQVDPLFLSREDSPYFFVKDKVKDVNGKPTGDVEGYIIEIKDPALARAMKGEIGIKSETAFAIINHIGKYTRFLANLATSWNPEFLFMNMQRDIAAAGINLQQFELDGVSKEMVKNVIPSIKTLWQMTPRTRLNYLKTGEADHFIRSDIDKLPEASREHARMAMDFLEDGGSVEFQGIRELADITSHINDGLRDPASFSTLEKGKQYIERFGDFIESYNKIVENGTRLSVYASLRKALEGQGMDSVKARMHAARAAKNMTANFNRGGELKPLVNALYMFYNASVQGSFALAHGLVTSKRVQTIAGGILLAGAAQDAMMQMISPTDENGRSVYDNIPEWALRTRMIFIDPFGIIPKGYMAIPMPHGYSAMFNFGRATMRAARGGYTPGEAASSAFGTLASQFDPVGGTGSWLNFVAPTVLDPIVDLSLNQDYKGDPIAKTPSAYGVQSPQSQLYWNNTSPPAIKIADWLNQLSGGDVGISGAIDISPDQIDYVAGYLTGGAGRFLGRLQTGAEKALTGNLDDLTVSDIPIARAYVGGVSGRSATEQYIEARQAVLQPAKAIKDAAEAGDVKAANALRQAYGDKVRLMGVFQAVDSARNKLSNRLRQIQRNVNIPEERKSALVKQIKLQMHEQENRALRAYNGE